MENIDLEKAAEEMGFEGFGEMKPLPQKARVMAAIISGVGCALVTKVIVAQPDAEERGFENVGAMINGAIGGAAAYMVSGEIESTSENGAVALISGVTITTAALGSIAGKTIGLLLR